MNVIEVPMFRADRVCVQLIDLLATIHDNDWVWSVLEFYGVARLPSGESTLDFEERIRKSPRGVIYRWGELLKFAVTVEYVIDCLVVAVSHVEKLDTDKVMADDFEQCEVAIRAFDSSSWTLSASTSEILTGLEKAALGESAGAKS